MVSLCCEQAREVRHSKSVSLNSEERLTCVLKKPLTMYFLRRAHDLYLAKPTKSLSPLFWDAEGKQPSERGGFDAVMAGIEHPLGALLLRVVISVGLSFTGRLLYTTGDIAGAVQMFLGLLRGSSLQSIVYIPHTESVNGSTMGSDKEYLEDFRAAFKHLQEYGLDDAKDLVANLRLPFVLSTARSSRVRLASDHEQADLVFAKEIWEAREDQWRSFRKGKGKEALERGGKAVVNGREHLSFSVYVLTML